MIGHESAVVVKTRMHVNTCYCILLNITANTIVIEPGILARIMDYQVLFKAHLRDASRKGGDVRSAHHIYPQKAGSGWRYWDHPVHNYVVITYYYDTITPNTV